MPHSSGGGSSSHGSHSSSRSSKSADMRYGKRYYRGANRYVYYLNGSPQYYYSDRPYTAQVARGERIRSIFSKIFTAIFAFIYAAVGFFALPQKVKLDYDTEIIINDSARLVPETEEAEMREAFLAFQNKTGVTPAFYTISNKELKRQGGDLHDYAYRLYVDNFEDEKHWLVVYCIDNVDKSWQWEGMIGDDCDSIITTDMENDFTKQLQADLDRDPEKISAAVINAFETTGSKAGKPPLSKLLIFGAAVLVGGYLVFSAIKIIAGSAKKDTPEDPRINSVQCPTAEAEPETAKCQYCGGVFVVGVHTNCPHCGAPIENWE